MIPVKLEELIFEGKAEFKTQTFGMAEQFILSVNPKSFIIILGFEFSPRAFAKNSGSQEGDSGFMLQQLIFSDARKSNSFLYKPFFNLIAKGTDEIFFTQLIQSQNLYLIFESDVSIFTYITDIEAAIFNQDNLPAANLLRPVITAGGTQAITSIDDINQAGSSYAPLQKYGESIGLPKGSQRDLIVKQGAYTPNTDDPSNYPYLTVQYVEMKFPKPEMMQ